MQNVVVIARNEEACKLLDCLVAYKKRMTVNPSAGSSEAEDLAVGLVEVSAADLRRMRRFKLKFRFL